MIRGTGPAGRTCPPYHSSQMGQPLVILSAEGAKDLLFRACGRAAGSLGVAWSCVGSGPPADSRPKVQHLVRAIPTFDAGLPMALIVCPDCGERISDSAPSCIHCGRPMSGGAGVAAASPERSSAPVRTLSASEYSCPRCRSEDVRKLSIIHHSGLSSVQSSTLIEGAAVSRGGLGVGVGAAQTAGMQQTSLSKSVAPPEQKKPDGKLAGPGCAVMVVGIVLAAATDSSAPFWFCAILGLAVAAVMVDREQKEVKKWNETEWLKLKAVWDRSLMCMRCGNVWEVPDR